MSELIQWRDNYPTAQEEAQQANLPLVLEFYLEGCPHCARLARETHQDAAVVKALSENYIPVRLEGRGHPDLVKQFQVTGAPTTLVLSPQGKEKHRIVGFKPAEAFLKELAQAG